MHNKAPEYYQLTNSDYGYNDMRFHKRGRGVGSEGQCQALCAGYSGCKVFTWDTTLRRCELLSSPGAAPQGTRDHDLNFRSGKAACLPGKCQFCGFVRPRPPSPLRPAPQRDCAADSSCRFALPNSLWITATCMSHNLRTGCRTAAPRA